MNIACGVSLFIVIGRKDLAKDRSVPVAMAIT